MLIFLYDEAGSPVGFQYRNSTYASDQFDTYWYRKNLKGDVMAIYDADGTTIAWYAYDAFGKQTYGAWKTHASNLYKNIYNLNPYRYRGYYYDTETSLYYLNSRYYDPNTCRFINADGFISTGQGILGNNMYAYCLNNPISLVDESGSCAHTGVELIHCRRCSNAKGEKIFMVPVIVSISDGNPIDPSIFRDEEYSNAQNDISIMGLVASTVVTLPPITNGLPTAPSMVATGVGVAFSTPANIVTHACNPSLTPGEKGIMIGYEVVSATGAFFVTYGIANCWNVTGWAALVYSGLAWVTGYLLNEALVNN